MKRSKPRTRQRTSISVSAATFDKVRAAAIQRNQSYAAIVAAMVAAEDVRCVDWPACDKRCEP